jgi:glutamate-1-semialdehyde 2,1-aminomutase
MSIETEGTLISNKILEQYLSKTPTSKLLWELAEKRLPSGLSRDSLFYPPYPCFARKAEGSKIVDVDGNFRIDFCFNFTSLILGHNHPAVTNAVLDQLENGTVFGAPTELEFKLANEIYERVRTAEQIRFTVTGTEANMLAFRLARAFTSKSKIAKFEGAYHGSSDAALVSVHQIQTNNKTAKSRAISTADSLGLQRGTLEETIVLPYNDPDAVDEIIRENRNELAAVIVEPVMRGIEPKKELLQRLREITSMYNILLIFDEVITGFRLARGGAQEKYGISPDITTFGKVIGGGFPIGAIGGPVEIMSLMSFSKIDDSYSLTRINQPKVPQSGTFNAHPISLAAGLATLKELNANSYETLNNRGEQMRRSLTKILQEERIIAQVYGVGSLFHLAFAKEPVTDYRSYALADKTLIRVFDIGMMNHGIYLAPSHFSCTSTVTSNSDINKAVEAAREVLHSLCAIIKTISPQFLR